MLIELRMSHWRKHLDKTIYFTEGLNAIRGANENGKTSMLWAIAYVLWGAKCLPLSMDEMVTWGYPTKNAKVGMILKIHGELYNFTRSSAGAECQHNGDIVTGQNEVSKFATELLGVNADMAMKLMFAPQGDLRGALQSGPTAISSYIEDMSGMDLFDRLMDLIAEKLPTGPTTRLDSDVGDLEEKLERGGPKEPDVSDINNRCAAIERDLHLAEGNLKAAETAAAAANDAYSLAKAAADVREASLKNLNAAEHSRDRRLAQQDLDDVAAAKDINEPRIDFLTMAITDATALEARKVAYKAFSAIPVTDMEWEGDEASLKAAVNVAQVSIRTTTAKINGLKSDIREAKAKLTTSSICGFCDQDLSKFPEVAKKNAEINAQVTCWEKGITDLEAEMVPVVEELDSLNAVNDSTGPTVMFLRKFASYVEVDHGFVPARLAWKGVVPTGDSNAADMQKELDGLHKVLRDKTAAKTRLEQLVKDLAQDEITIAQIKASIPEPVDVDVLYRAKLSADTDAADIMKSIRTARETIQTLEGNKSRLHAEFELARRAFAAVAIDLEKKKSERDDLYFNNALIKRVKAARPIVASKLWSIVLTSVSSMFSVMRGEQSIVTKGVKGFLVNDKPCEALSGSALDLLGFAIRVAMLKTFIPDCSFLILDEATSACDDDRTASLLGFIAGAGFPQTLLVTHESASESVADNVVLI